MEQYLPAALAVSFLVVTAGVVVVGVRQRRLQMRMFAAHFADGGYQARPAGLASVVVTSPPGPLQATLTLASSTDKNSKPLWRVVVNGVGLGARTTFLVLTEGLLGSVLNRVGLKDVECGDKGFDDRFMIRGTDRDVVRAAIADPAVRAAIERLFEHEVSTCLLDQKGRLAVDVRRRNLSADVARRVMEATLQLAEALHAQTDAKALSPPLDDKVQSAGAGSGASVAVRASLTKGGER